VSKEPSYEVSFWIRKILVPIDKSKGSLRAIQLAEDFSRRYGSKVTILRVISDKENREEEEKYMKELLSSVKDLEGISYKIISVNLEETSVPNEILREVEEGGYDMIIINARGTSLSREITMGSTALSVVINSPVSVIVIR
jgi:nucleotide-binding universal stress UspA family protein